MQYAGAVIASQSGLARSSALKAMNGSGVPALAALLDEGIARGEGELDVAAGVRVPR